MLKIYITNLGKYNEGELCGMWLDLPATDEELAEAFDRIEVCYGDKMHYDSVGAPYEEYFITDIDTDIEGLEIDEYVNLDELNELAKEIDSLEEWELDAVKAIVEYGESLKWALENYDDVEFYADTTLEDLAYQFVDEGSFGEIAESIKGYIDYKAIARDLGIDGYHELNDGVIRI